jgi:hypothetical protein
VSDEEIVHLAWDRVTVHLEIEEIHLLAQTLQEETPEEHISSMSEQDFSSENGHQAEWDGFEETVQLWLGDIALMLNIYDFQIFMDMVLEASLMLEVEEYLDDEEIMVEMITVPIPDWFVAEGDMMFSLN